MAKEYSLNSKQKIDDLFRLIKNNNWEATDFLFKNCWKYCRKIYFKRGWHVNEEDLNTIINYSIGKAIAKYKVCGKYWGLLGKIFANEIFDELRRIIKEKEMERKVIEENINLEQEDNRLAKRDKTLLIEKALPMKPEEHQKCIQLELEGYSDEQIKKFLGTKKSIKDLKHHAKLNLKKVLSNNFNWKPKKD